MNERKMNDWAIVLLATRGLGDFVENALKGIVRCGVEPALVQVVIPANAKNELHDLIERFGARARMLEEFIGEHEGGLPSQYADFNTPEFRRLMNLRFFFIRVMLKENKRVLYADVDVAWFRNPLGYLTEVLHRYPWACQTESVGQFPPAFCLGFYAVRSSPEVLDFIDRQLAAYMRDPDPLSDQERFNQIVRGDPQYLASIFPLPEGLFANGLLYRSMDAPAKDDVVMAGRLEPFIFHGNWTIGVKNKRRLLMKAGAWLIS